MFGEHYPTDETLRLILAADQEQWLLKRIRESKSYIVAMSALLVLCLAWGGVHFKDALSYYDGPDCYILTGDISNPQKIHREFQAMGLKPCSAENSVEEKREPPLGWKDVQAVTTFASLILILVSILTLIRHLFQFKKYKNYLIDHRAFMAKYNRL